MDTQSNVDNSQDLQSNKQSHTKLLVNADNDLTKLSIKFFSCARCQEATLILSVWLKENLKHIFFV